jgi:hypothetical protein
MAVLFLAGLFTLLRNAGAQTYDIFTPCTPSCWTLISESIEAHRYLQVCVSDRCVSKL